MPLPPVASSSGASVAFGISQYPVDAVNVNSAKANDSLPPSSAVSDSRNRRRSVSGCAAPDPLRAHAHPHERTHSCRLHTHDAGNRQARILPHRLLLRQLPRDGFHRFVPSLNYHDFYLINEILISVKGSNDDAIAILISPSYCNNNY